MLTHLLISVISDDKPGIVEAIAESVAGVEGNWLESRLSQLGGKFAGVIRVSVTKEKLLHLQQALDTLKARNIWIKAEQVTANTNNSAALNSACVHVLGPDRPGIIKELSKALAKNQINFANLETSLSSIPYSGEPLFEATGELEIPASVDMQELHDTFNEIADTLALDISLSERPPEPS